MSGAGKPLSPPATNDSQPANKRFITKKALAQRWSVNPVTVDRKVKSDPAMPKPFKFTRVETFDIGEIEVYERMKAAER